MCTNPPINRLTIAAMFNGNRQYPKRQMLWKKEMLPPRSYPLTAMTAPPIHTIQKTISNSNVLSSALVAILSTLRARKKTWFVRKLALEQKVMDLRGQHQAEEKWTPQVPVTDLFTLGLRVDLGQRVNDDSKLLPNSLQISLL